MDDIKKQLLHSSKENEDDLEEGQMMASKMIEMNRKNDDVPVDDNNGFLSRIVGLIGLLSLLVTLSLTVLFVHSARTFTYWTATRDYLHWMKISAEFTCIVAVLYLIHPNGRQVFMRLFTTWKGIEAVLTLGIMYGALLLIVWIS